MDEAAGAGGPTMSTAKRTSEHVGDPDKSPEDLRHEIDQTRDQLGDTVEALAEKTDVKARAKQRITAIRGTVRQKREQARAKAEAATPDSSNARAQQVAATAKQNPLPLVTAGALLIGFVLGRRKSS